MPVCFLFLIIDYSLMFDFGIHSNRVIAPGGIKDATVLVKNGLIEDILPGNMDTAIDVKDSVLMPGIIDPHVHINEPGRTEWEGFDTATKAAIAGGITTLVDMPLNSSPVTTTVKAFEEKIAATYFDKLSIDKLSMSNKLHCNCGFWGGIIPGNENDIEGLIEKGVLGFKAFLIHSGINEFPNVEEKDLRKAMPIIAKYGLPLLIHCELATNHLPATPSDRAGNNQQRSYRNYLASRPRKWEDEAIALMIRLCEEFNCRVHIVHLSSSDSLEQIKKAKERGLPLTVETGQHYLYFNAEEIRDGQTQFKSAPPIREKENNEKLWQALKDGIIDLVATDHSPSTPDLKDLPTGQAGLQGGDFMKAWGGIASLQFALPVLWTAAKKRNCTPEDMVKWLCERPAKLIGKENSKGKIAKGSDADLIVWDPGKKFIVTEEMIQHRHKITPYLNEELSGVVEQTYLSGAKVFDKGSMELSRGKIVLHEF